MMAVFPQAQPLAGLIGGLMIGAAAAILLLGLGRIAGVSGLAARAIGLAETGAPRPVAIAFTLGLPLGAAIVALLAGPIEARYPASLAVLVVAGLLVGYGTRLGSGCTSGHGVCGLSRLSRRSIVATVLFIGSGVVTVATLSVGGWM